MLSLLLFVQMTNPKVSAHHIRVACITSWAVKIRLIFKVKSNLIKGKTANSQLKNKGPSLVLTRVIQLKISRDFISRLIRGRPLKKPLSLA
jgi:hypothetical protein